MRIPNRPPKINGTPMVCPMKTLERRAQHYEEKAAAIRQTMAILGEHSGASSARRGSSTIDAAIALDAQRRGPGPRGGMRLDAQPGYGSKANQLIRRKRTAAVLATYDSTTPNAKVPPAVGTLIRTGYLRKKGDGYVRTAKVFTP